MGVRVENLPLKDEQTEQEALLPLPEWLVEMNQQLASAAASAAEQAFGLGCTVSLVPMTIMMGLAYLLGVRHWVSLFLVAIALLLLATAWASFVAMKAHRNAPRRAWQEILRAETAAGLEARCASSIELEAEAQNILPEEALLRRALRGDFE
jgi:hypothetical protein